jgi:hypothetical protein
MIRSLVYGLAILHLGPALAFGLLAFGCEGSTPYLVAVCGRSVVASFVSLTAVSWLILGLGLVAVHRVRIAQASVLAHPRVRIGALLAVLAVGVLLAVSGDWLTGSEYWLLAVPSALATGWLFLANPLACQQPPSSDASRG